jgi:hypothetical protein
LPDTNPTLANPVALTPSASSPTVATATGGAAEASAPGTASTGAAATATQPTGQTAFPVPPANTLAEALSSPPGNPPKHLADAQAPDAFPMLPPSTRLDYRLSGWYRGELQGLARVDWLRQADRYQVRLSVRVPGMVERRMLSEGVLTENGLSPRRYDQETDALFSATRRETMRFSADRVYLVNGRSEPSPPGVQDTASQFVQMSLRFLTGRQRLQAGDTVAMPLALPRRVGVWTYDVLGPVTLALPFDPALPTFHLKPRADAARPGEMTVEMWLAPGLQFLPVRIVIHQDAQNYLQLDLASRPLQADATQ